jgi:hypothetical protein
VYIGEISQAAHRGQLVTWSEIAVSVASVCLFVKVLAYHVNQYLSWYLIKLSIPFRPM